MTMGIRFTEKVQVVPVFAPASSSDAGETAAVALKNAQWITFLLQIGTLATDSDDLITVSVITGTTNTTGAADTAIPFKYRLSSAVGTDSWGAITDGTTAGVRIEATTDNSKAMLIDVDPASIPALDEDASFVYVDLATTTIASGYVSACAFIEPRYPQNSQLTSS